MSAFNIEVAGGSSVRLPTAGKYCDRDIIVTATGGGGGSGEENQLHGSLDGSLTKIDSNVTKVRNYACHSCSKILTVNLPNATYIGSSAFRGCSAMKTFSAPKVTSLGTYVFYGCGVLHEVNFPGISSIPSTCFYQCAALKKADFGVNCKSIAASGLAYCYNLTTLILRYTGGVVSIATNSFSGANFDGYVYVPSALLEAYKSDASWKSYAGSPTFRAIEDYPDICGS